MAKRNVVVTGAAGLVGAEVVARLLAGGHAVVAVTHDNGELVRNNGRRIRTKPFRGDFEPESVVVVRGDITDPGLGLSSEIRRVVANRSDLVVHNAAVTDFGLDPARYESVNVTGTRHLLGFLTAGSRRIPLVHVSTAYVCGDRTGVVREDELDLGQRHGNPYEASKFHAEVAVAEVRADGWPVAVVRPSVVVGNQRTGAIREFRNMYIVIKVLTQGRLRAIPGLYDAVIDLVPIDRVADVIARVSDRFDTAAGKTLHVTGASPLTLRDFSDVLAEYPNFHVPRYIPPANWQLDQLTAAEQRYYRSIMVLYEDYFRRRAFFDTTVAREIAGGKPAIEGRAHLRKLLDHGLRVGYFGPPPRTVSRRTAQLQGS
ncbi:SDR family oxidoreductase [Actinophytocola xanthii]|uniref:Thioester reductase (TE) domain-containing protein n=1 Tax=Actinophytocola xanthii TaxID=1912961 RepID=A0A1Q8CNM9_9PSEU|nr:SDR family oxidoreductase [Actinophytocola xanthii]OLF15950.1 hypothetical protein BU204_18755 [Actinophytocola xanthii]